MKMKSLLLVTLAMLGLTAATMAQNLPNYVPTNGIVGWWPFNGNANDESGNINDGTVNGATLTADRFGNADKAYSFDGVNDFIEINDNNIFHFGTTTSFSTALWVKYNTNMPATALISKALPTNPADGYQIMLINNNPVFDIVNTTFSGNTTLNDNIWHSIVFTANRASNEIIFYIDGILNVSIIDPNLSVNDLTNSSSLKFGKLRQPGGALFNGNIDDIGIWNRVLTQQEITDLYNGNICYQNITVTDTLLINMGITGFNPITYNNTIKIFPNPANNHITIDYGNFATMNGYQLKIENSLGQQLFQTNITQQTDYLSLNNWGGNGLYFVHIIDAQGNTIDIRKIVLQ